MLTANVSQIIPPFVTKDNVFSEEELVKIESYCNTKQTMESNIGNGAGHLDTRVRLCDIAFIGASSENHWLFSKLLQLTDSINSNTYRYDLTGFDYIQHTLYNKEGSHYSWHMDMAMGSGDIQQISRKLSLILVLTDPKEYTGGEFQIQYTGAAPAKVEQKRGRIIAFPSFMMHRVTPVSEGIRKSIVFWALGPKFK